jgi:site-specific recombinase XerD
LLTAGHALPPRLTAQFFHDVRPTLVPAVIVGEVAPCFATEYRRNGGKMLALQELLGHSDLKMVKRYAQIAQSDCANVHRKTSLADNWRL